MSNTAEKPAVSTVQTQAPSSASSGGIASWALTIIVFMSGACLMGMEIAGAKILAPGFGTSTFVWGSIIGLFMGALAAGYYIGGNIADRKPSFVFLATVVSISGVLTALIPRFGPAVADWVARRDMGIVVGPLMAATIIFFLPSFLMGMVSPYAVKLKASSLHVVGGVAGRLYALSTLGSIIGTLLTTFVLIPAMSVSNVLQLLGLILIVCAIVSLAMFRSVVGKMTRDDRTGLGVMALFALLCLEAWLIAPVRPLMGETPRVLHVEDSPYHEILVTESVIQPRDQDNGYTLLPVRVWNADNKGWEVRRWLRFNENTESGIFPYRSEYANAVTYTDLLHLPLIWVNNPAPKKILVVGGGGGVIPTQYSDWYGTESHVAEIDGAVERIAKDYFQVPDSPLIKFHIEDGRQTVRKMRKSGEKFDVIVLDAYSSGGQIPSHLMTWEFMSEVRDCLTERGVLITNIISGLRNLKKHDIPPADLFLSNFKTLKSSPYDVTKREGDSKEPLFSQLYVFPKNTALSGDKYEDYQNVIILATREKERKSESEIEEIARALVRGEKPLVKADGFVGYATNQHLPRPEEIEKATPLTDDYAPVDLMYRPVRRDETTRRIFWQ
ncbi:MAG TPA: fused MFS/spermidine synthase [Planctomycetota bacterium]|nr:fused MFS/spermidine synthase [Planctomycetota bacterium]